MGDWIASWRWPTGYELGIGWIMIILYVVGNTAQKAVTEIAKLRAQLYELSEFLGYRPPPDYAFTREEYEEMKVDKPLPDTIRGLLRQFREEDKAAKTKSKI